MRRGIWVVVWLVIFAPGSWGDEQTDNARTHYQRATSLYDVGRFAEAAREYEAAYQLKNDPALLFNLGQAYRYAGDYGNAIVAYRSYLRNLPQTDNRSEVEGYIAKAQAAQRAADARKAKPESTPAKPAPSVAERPADVPSVADAGVKATGSPARQAAYKKWWVWTIVGVVAAGGAVGLALGLTLGKPGQTTPVFPAVGGQP